MVDIKVGDWVKLEHWDEFWEVCSVTDDKVYVKYGGWKVPYNLENNKHKWIKRDNPTPSPVREVVTKELVDGVYGRVELTTAKENKDVNPVFIRLLSRSQKTWEGELGFTAKELRELAKTLNDVAEFLEGE